MFSRLIRIVLVIALSLISEFCLFSQNKSLSDSSCFYDECWCIWEEDASFRGGDIRTFYKYILDQLEKPIFSNEIKGVGEILVQFDIDKEGFITNIELYRKTPYADLNKEIKNILQHSPRFKPAKAYGCSVSKKLTILIQVRENYDIEVKAPDDLNSDIEH
jgi:hypothetical protein